MIGLVALLLAGLSGFLNARWYSPAAVALAVATLVAIDRIEADAFGIGDAAGLLLLSAAIFIVWLAASAVRRLLVR